MQLAVDEAERTSNGCRGGVRDIITSAFGVIGSEAAELSKNTTRPDVPGDSVGDAGSLSCTAGIACKPEIFGRRVILDADGERCLRLDRAERDRDRSCGGGTFEAKNRSQWTS